MTPVVQLAILIGDMALGKAGGADGKLAGFADELHELRRILEAARGGDEVAAARGIAAQGEDIFAIERTDPFEEGADLSAGMVHAGEVRERGQVVFLLDAIDDGE